MMPDIVIEDIFFVAFFSLFLAFVLIAAWIDWRQWAKKKKAPITINWEEVLEEAQKEPEEYDDSHVW